MGEYYCIYAVLLCTLHCIQQGHSGHVQVVYCSKAEGRKGHIV